MWKKRYLLALALAGSLCVQTSYSAQKWEIKRSHYYLTGQQQQLLELPPPPAAGSEIDIADLATLHEWQEKRTDAQCARANAEANADYSVLFDKINPFPEPLPVAAAAVLKRVKTETDDIARIVKNKFKRPRPFNRDSSLEPCLGRIGGLAYPSGHATISRIYALILSDLAPEHMSEFMTRADEVALYRVIGGVHHPTDIEAGKKLADTIYPLYLKSAAFQADMNTLRGYLLRAPVGSTR